MEQRFRHSVVDTMAITPTGPTPRPMRYSIDLTQATCRQQWIRPWQLQIATHSISPGSSGMYGFLLPSQAIVTFIDDHHLVIKRLAEFKDKTNDIIMSNLGQERAKEMIELSGIAVHPDLQGIGYGTQLGQVADSQGRESFVISSNEAANTAFYKYLGYETIATYTVGESNPAWKKPPVHLALITGQSGILYQKYSPKTPAYVIFYLRVGRDTRWWLANH
ncbi:hypothetical protein C8Q75DRAFT_729728 [Abortiporus biennis]|nr:hypothetical protein C8Q75DRAFT_729728 [Abortiporus biennis]